MIREEEVRVALGEWHLLTHCQPGHTPAEALARVTAITGDRAVAVRALFEGASEFLGMFVHAAQRHPRASAVWFWCQDVCICLQFKYLNSACGHLDSARVQAARLTREPEATGERHERHALLAWCERAKTVCDLLWCIQNEAEKPPTPTEDVR